MRRIFPILFCLLAAIAGTAPLKGATVATPAKRQSVLDLATRLLAPHPAQASQIPDDLVSPFNPDVKFGNRATSGGVARVATSSDREVLEKLAAAINPSGMVTIGGRPMLLLREKKLKVGDSLKLSSDGFEYTVVVTAIDPTTFRLRLNHEETTRPIKPGKTP